MSSENKKNNHYEWLIIAEGNSDIYVYKEYLKRSDSDIPNFEFISVGGKSFSLNMKEWHENHIKRLITDAGRHGFKGIILLIDTDNNINNPFYSYDRSSELIYISSEKPNPVLDESKKFWILDKLSGSEAKIVVHGVNVPRDDDGCLESDLLASYGFPVKSQQDYDSLACIIKKVTAKWMIPNNEDGKPWWELNERAKMDKFIYWAFKKGFIALKNEVKLPPEPNVIGNLRAAML